MGLKLTLDTTFTDNTLPKFYPHRLMSEGSLLLLNFAHPDGALSAVPANNTMLNNIAREQAVAIIGAGATLNDMNPFYYNNQTAQGGMAELTPKKGLHGIVSHVNDLTSGNDMSILIPTKIREYIHANIGRGFYVSMWYRLTRLHTQAVAADMMLLLQNTGNYAMAFQRDGTIPVSGANFLGTRSVPSPTNQLGNQFRNVGISGLVGTPNNAQPSYVKWGSGGAYSGFELNKAASHILYQLYIEDLTASGRTYAQADAADYALWQEAFGPGGIYEGDTFTDPAMLP